MPELPEVEVVRRGLESHAVGRTITAMSVLHPRAVRRHIPGGVDLANVLTGATIDAARRRGKYLWLDASIGAPLVVHLGMSGQMLVTTPDTPDHTHLRIRVSFDDGNELRFVDQRTFGGWFLDDYTPAGIPSTIAHIAPDPFDPAFDPAAVVSTWRHKHTEIKRALLDQSVVSGVGNIYADESLWRTKLHGARLTNSIGPKKLIELLGHTHDVMSAALAVGGTSFDALYVNVNGNSGYFERSLDAYGREGLPCRRCGTIMRREQFMNRSSFSCPKCQRRPRVRSNPSR